MDAVIFFVSFWSKPFGIAFSGSQTCKFSAKAPFLTAPELLLRPAHFFLALLSRLSPMEFPRLVNGTKYNADGAVVSSKSGSLPNDILRHTFPFSSLMPLSTPRFAFLRFHGDIAPVVPLLPPSASFNR